jgi:hypothetical protein
MEIAQDIANTNLAAFFRQGKLPTRDHQGFYLLIAKKVSEIIPDFPEYEKFLMDFETAAIELQKDRTLDEGWEGIKMPSPKNSPKRQPVEEHYEMTMRDSEELEDEWEGIKAPSPKRSPKPHLAKACTDEDDLSIDDFMEDSVIIRSD